MEGRKRRCDARINKILHTKPLEEYYRCIRSSVPRIWIAYRMPCMLLVEHCPLVLLAVWCQAYLGKAVLTRDDWRLIRRPSHLQFLNLSIRDARQGRMPTMRANIVEQPSEEQLLAQAGQDRSEMLDLRDSERHATDAKSTTVPHISSVEQTATSATTSPAYRVYKRRWFGLVQLILLNIIVSWDVCRTISSSYILWLNLRSQWLSYASVANTAATFYSTKPTTINWLSTAFLFAFLVASPCTLYSLHKSGPRSSIIIASALILSGRFTARR